MIWPLRDLYTNNCKIENSRHHNPIAEPKLPQVMMQILNSDFTLLQDNVDLMEHFCHVQEHHLQRAICTGLIIPTPEVVDLADAEAYNKIYPLDYKLPRQLIHMQRKCNF
jgi:hypothetical protein